MRKNILCLCLICMLCLWGCGSSDLKLTSYESQISTVIDSMEAIDTRMNAIDPDSITADSDMLSCIQELDALFEKLAEIEAPSSDYQYVNDLAAEAREYMSQATALYQELLSAGSEYDPDAALLAYEYYSRACRRVSIIVAMLHGNTPDGVTISYE